MEKQTKTKWLHVRMSEEEYGLLNSYFKASTCKKVSDYVRTKLLERPIIKAYRDKSLDDFMDEMILLRTELNRLGNNYNQAVKKLHTLNTVVDFQQWIRIHNVEKHVLFNKIEAIKNTIQNFAKIWLQ